MSESAKKPLVVLTYVVLILSTLLVFRQVRDFDFVNYDDDDYVYENPQVLGGLTAVNITRAFATSHHGYWQPLTWLSLMLDCQLFGPDPGWMHLVNIFLHLANTLLLFAVFKRMTGALWPSAFVAAAFALHPMHVESVAWITERKDVLNTLFLLLTLAAYVSYVKRGGAVRYVLTAVLFALGLLGKAMLVTLPFLFLLLDYWPLNRFEAQPAKASGQPREAVPVHDGRAILYRIIIEKIPFFVLAAVSSVIAFVTLRAGDASIDVKTIPLNDRVANTFLSYARYIGKMFWPENLAAFYPFDAGTIRLWQVVLCALLLVGVSVLAIRLRRTRKYLPVGWFWFVGTLLPVIGLVQFTGSSYADRFTYIPHIGLFIMIAWGLPELLSKWRYRKFALGVSAAVALTALGICAHRQAGYWRNSIALFSHAIEVTQNNDVAYNDRGVAYYDLGRWQEAIDDLNQAIKIRPDYTEAHTNLGIVYGRLGRYQDAVDAHTQAIGFKPDYAEARNNRGVAYVSLGRWQEAIEDFGQAIRINPDHAEAHYNLGRVFGSLGHRQEAIDAYKQVIRIDPADAEARYNLANELASQGECDEAIDQYRAALRLKPDQPSFMNGLALAIATGSEVRNRDANEAIRLASRACELTGHSNPVFLGTLAAAYASAGRFSEAIDTANKAVNLADAANLPQVKNIIQYHLSFYTQGRPYIEPGPRLPSDSNRP